MIEVPAECGRHAGYSKLKRSKFPARPASTLCKLTALSAGCPSAASFIFSGPLIVWGANTRAWESPHPGMKVCGGVHGGEGARHVFTDGHASPWCRRRGAQGTRRQELVDCRLVSVRQPRRQCHVWTAETRCGLARPARLCPHRLYSLRQGRDPGKPKCLVCKIPAVTGMAKDALQTSGGRRVRCLGCHKCSQILPLFPFVSRQTHAPCMYARCTLACTEMHTCTQPKKLYHVLFVSLKEFSFQADG